MDERSRKWKADEFCLRTEYFNSVYIDCCVCILCLLRNQLKHVSLTALDLVLIARTAFLYWKCWIGSECVCVCVWTTGLFSNVKINCWCQVPDWVVRESVVDDFDDACRQVLYDNWLHLLERKNATRFSSTPSGQREGLSPKRDDENEVVGTILGLLSTDDDITEPRK